MGKTLKLGKLGQIDHKTSFDRLFEPLKDFTNGLVIIIDPDLKKEQETVPNSDRKKWKILPNIDSELKAII